MARPREPIPRKRCWRARKARAPGGDGQHAAGTDQAPHLGDELRHIRREEHPEYADHRVKAAIRQRGHGRIARQEPDVGQALAGRPGAGHLQQRLRDVDAKDASFRTDEARSRNRRRSRAAAQVEHGMPGRQRQPGHCGPRRTGPRNSARPGRSDRRQPRRCVPLSAHVHPTGAQRSPGLPLGDGGGCQS